MEEKQKEIINKIKELKELKRIKKLKIKLENNKKYNELINKKIDIEEELINVRKELFKINDFKEYQELYTKLKLNFIKISKIISSVISSTDCKNHLN